MSPEVGTGGFLPTSALEVRRPFHWGIVVFCDNYEVEPWPELDRHELFAASEICVIAAVRHAQDVDISGMDPDTPAPHAEVAVRVWIGDPPEGPFNFDGELTINSGKLSVGDADHSDVVEISPGRWRIRIQASPLQHAEEILVYLTG